MPQLSPNLQPKNDIISFSRIALALANDYESVYLIDMEDDSYVEYSASGAEKQLVVRSSGENFFADVPKQTRMYVYPEDQAHFMQAFRRETLIDALKTGKSFSLNYRLVKNGRPVYYFLKTIRGAGEDDRFVVIGVQNVDEQVEREKRVEAEQRTYSEIARSLASLYEVIYYIDIMSNHYNIYSSSPQFSSLGLKTEGNDFFANAKMDIASYIHPEDKELLLRTLNKKALLAQMRDNGSCSVTYRQILDGREQYLNLLAFWQQQNPTHIVIGVRNIDDQVRREHEVAAETETYSRIARALASRYEVIYYIDLRNNEYIEYSSSEQYSKLGITKKGEDFFKACIRDIRTYIHPEDREKLIAELEKERLICSLSVSGSISLTYRQMLDDRAQYVTMIVVKPKNDDNHVLMGVLNVDAQIRREQSIAAEHETFEEIVRALAKRYEVIYYVDVDTNEYYEYSASDKYARLSVGARGEDFFGDSQKNMKRDIYPEDYPMMAKAIEKEQVLHSLEETGFATLNYRLILDGRPQYVTLSITRTRSDSHHLIFALANVDASMRREIAFREALGSAMDLANRDALTGVKNKHAYVQAEVELDNVIGTGTPVDFAIVICDVNGLKHVNDTQGHSAGDSFIKSACQIICLTFKHSPVFRIGGDEFAVILRGQDYQNRTELMTALRETVQQNREQGLVTVASGISEFRSGADLRVQDVFERADNAMYDNKKKMRSVSD